jgi:predicted unusual protein kinase regulating ubiquinone biosynthesis (AarF/ABC1/UbiB family)
MKSSHLGRYKDIGMLLVEHRHAVDSAADADPEEMAGDARELATSLEALGPTFVKLGQLLSTRADLLPDPYLHALARLQDSVEPIGFGQIERIVSEELGVRLSKGFAEFESTPLAAASLGQVHRARLRDGRAVAVKVQRPDIRSRIVDDMDAIEEIASLADAHTDWGKRLGFADMVAEFRTSLMAELDYQQEAENLRAVGANLAGREGIVVPRPIADYTTSRVLTMDFVDGRSVGSLGPLALIDIDGPALASTLFGAYLDQILVDGLFHADPHPGNVLVTDDGRLALLDLGMVGRVEPEMQDSLTKLLLAISEGQGRRAAEVAIVLGRPLDDFDGEAFRRRAADLVMRSQDSTVGELQAGATIAELSRIAAESGLRLPPSLTMLAKTLLNLDDVSRTLDPTFDPGQAIQRESSDLLRRKLLTAASPAHVMAAAMEAKEFAEMLPARVNRVMDALASGELTLNVQGIDERDIMRGVQKLANRLAFGVVVASLVVGAALIMPIETSAKLFGYPALAIAMFLLAAAAGVGLLISIQLGDLPQRKRRWKHLGVSVAGPRAVPDPWTTRGSAQQTMARVGSRPRLPTRRRPTPTARSVRSVATWRCCRSTGASPMPSSWPMERPSRCRWTGLRSRSDRQPRPTGPTTRTPRADAATVR